MQPCLEYLPFGGVYHHRHAGYVGLGGNEVEEGCHGLHAVYHAVVHADVYHLRPVLHLVARHCQRLVVASFLYKPLELCRPCHVGALADVHEARVGAQAQWLEAREGAGCLRAWRVWRAWLVVIYSLLQCLYVLWRGATATAVDVHQTVIAGRGEEVRGRFGEGLRCLVISAHHVRQSCVGVHGDGAGGYLRHAAQPRQQLFRAEAAVQSYGEQVGVGEGCHEGLHRLPRQRASGGVRQCSGCHDGYVRASLLGKVVDGLHRRFGVESVEDSLY